MSLPLNPPLAPAARALAREPARRRRLGLRAQVRRLSRSRLRRWRRDLSAVAQRQAAEPLLPRAGLPAGALRPRRRDRRGLVRHARPAHPPGGVAHRAPGRGDAGDLLRLRPPGARRRRAARALLRRAPRRARGPRPGSRRADRCRPHRGRRRALAARGRGRDRQGCGGAVPPRRAHGHGQGQARAHRRRRRPRLAPGQGRAHRGRAHPRPVRRRAPAREVGHSSGFTAKEKRELVDFLAPYETGQRGSGEPSRWTQGRDLEWVGLRPELVVEITFDHVSDGRIRHGAKVQRWREDKAPEACTVDQLDQ